MASGWQAYIKNLIDNAPTVIKKAAIVGLNDGSLWARSEPPLGEAFNVSLLLLRFLFLGGKVRRGGVIDDCLWVYGGD